MKKKITAILTFLTLGMSMLLGGCGTTEEKDPSEAYLDTLKKGVMYVRHADYTCDELYLPANTFTETIVEYPDTDRMIWAKEDWDKVPTLYSGDALIYYTPDDFSEYFYWERFYDQGYSIGVRNLDYMDSGRVFLATDINKKLTYPKGDTDMLNKFKDNQYLIIESLGGAKIRRGEFSKLISNYGTLTGLTKGESYAAEVYNGTVRNDYTFCADVKILGSAETCITINYEFVKGKVIEIAIPKSWNSGYYMIDCLGIFRYVNGDSYDDDTDFNIPNEGMLGWLDEDGNSHKYGEDVTDPDVTPSPEASGELGYNSDDLFDTDNPENTYHYDENTGIYTYGSIEEWPDESEFMKSGEEYDPNTPLISTYTPAYELVAAKEYRLYDTTAVDALGEYKTGTYYSAPTEAIYIFTVPRAGKFALDVCHDKFDNVKEKAADIYNLSLKTMDGRYYSFDYIIDLNDDNPYSFLCDFETSTAGECWLYITYKNEPESNDKNSSILDNADVWLNKRF